MTGRALAFALLSAVLLLSGAGRAAEKGKSGTAPLREVREAPGWRYAYPLPEGVAPSAEPPAVSARIDRADLVFVDLDGNGRFDDAGVDGWTRAGPAWVHLVPVGPEIVVGDTILELTFAEGSVAWRSRSFPLPEHPAADRGVAAEVMAALGDWNDLRLRNGLPPVRLSPEITRGALLHAAYVVLHGITHEESPDAARFTEEGQKAAENSCQSQARPRAALARFYRQFHHRVPLFSPETDRVGIGTTGDQAVMDGLSGRTPRSWSYPALIPAPGTTDVPQAYVQEQPLPNAAEGSGAGFPITLIFDTSDVNVVSAALRLGGPEGAEVEFRLSSPEKPANAEFPDNHRAICLLPRGVLRSNASYHVRVVYRRQGDDAPRTVEWSFSTGR